MDRTTCPHCNKPITMYGRKLPVHKQTPIIFHSPSCLYWTQHDGAKRAKVELPGISFGGYIATVSNKLLNKF